MDVVRVETEDGIVVDAVRGEILVTLGDRSAEPTAITNVLSVSSDSATVMSVSNGVVRIVDPDLANEDQLTERINELAADPDVDFAEPNYVQHIAMIDPNDPLLSTQWHHTLIGSSTAWETTTGSSEILIAVVDTGVPLDRSTGALSHPDLADSQRYLLGTNYVDPAAPPRDDNGHGTHVLGLAAGAGNNAIGIAGLDWNARTVSIKVFDSQGNGVTSDVTNAFDEARRFAQARNLKLIVNYSGGSYANSQCMRAAVARLGTAGALLVTATGNDGDANILYPARLAFDMDHVIAVAATDSRDQKATFSNFGSGTTMCAPGVAISSTLPNYPLPGTGTNYGPMNGTSMATPLVSGAAGLVWASDLNLAAAGVRNALTNSARDLGPPGYDVLFGAGRLDLGTYFGDGGPPPQPPPPVPPTPIPDPPNPTPPNPTPPTPSPPVKTAYLMHLLNMGINLGWIAKELEFGGDSVLLPRWTSDARKHAIRARTFLDPYSLIDTAAQFLATGRMAEYNKAIRGAENNLRAQLGSTRCVGIDNGLLDHYVACGLRLGWSHLGAMANRPVSEVYTDLNMAREHALATKMISSDAVFAITRALPAARRMPTSNAAAGIGNAITRLGRDLSPKTCNCV